MYLCFLYGSEKENSDYFTIQRERDRVRENKLARGAAVSYTHIVIIIIIIIVVPKPSGMFGQAYCGR